MIAGIEKAIGEPGGLLFLGACRLPTLQQMDR